MQVQGVGIVGPQGNKNADGTAVNLRCGFNGEHLASHYSFRYTENTVRGKVFTTNTSSTPTTLSAVSNASETGLILYNPPLSGVNMALLEVCIAANGVSSGTGARYVLAAQSDPTLAQITIGTALSIIPCFLGSSGASVAKAASFTTFTNYYLIRVISGAPISNNVAPLPAFVRDEIAGAIVMQPNTTIGLLCASQSSVLTVVASITWAEIPI